MTVNGGSNYEWTPTIPGYENCDTCTVFKITADSSRVYTVRSKDETACVEDEAQLTITTGFIAASDQCNCLGKKQFGEVITIYSCLLYTSPSPRDATLSRMPSSA